MLTEAVSVHNRKKTMAPENRPLEKEIPIGNNHFWGPSQLSGVLGCKNHDFTTGLFEGERGLQVPVLETQTLLPAVLWQEIRDFLEKVVLQKKLGIFLVILLKGLHHENQSHFAKL